MPAFKNVSGVRLDLPALDLHVDPDGIFEVDDEAFAAGLAAQAGFEAVTDTTAPAAAPAPAPAVDPNPAPVVEAPAPAPAPATDSPAVDFTPSN